MFIFGLYSSSSVVNESLFPVQPRVAVSNISDCTSGVPLISHEFGESAVEDDSSSIFSTRQNEEAGLRCTAETDNI